MAGIGHEAYRALMLDTALQLERVRSRDILSVHLTNRRYLLFSSYLLVHSRKFVLLEYLFSRVCFLVLVPVAFTLGDVCTYLLRILLPPGHSLFTHPNS